MQTVMRRAALAAVAVTTLAAGLAACDDSSGPSGAIGGRYVLATVNGAPLPFVVYSGLLGPTRVLTAGSITVQGGDRLLDVRTFHLGPVTATAPSETDSATYAYTQRGNLLLVQRPRTNPAQSHVDSGQVTTDDVTLYVRYIWASDIAPQRATLLYRRVR